ncbi:MAG TPA: type II toxin-antitoxin system HipA family toxin [Ramlibacter sp.]|nr:type II toxin-antitoxin system HipA family toxin [Ramlibacter sp.]
MATNDTGRPFIEVHLDAPELGPCERVGKLFPAETRVDLPPSFEYAREWLNSTRVFQLDPHLDVYAGEQHARLAPGFGIFLDSAPDRWGRVLMERREALQASREGRRTRRLTDLDFLLGVHDFTRTGALRFRRGPEQAFLDDHDLPAPPVTDLRELAAIATKLDEPGVESLPEYEKWLSMLMAPGTSLGGARPKASFTQVDGTLWLAKFPGHDDRRDWGAWEYLTHQMARDAGIDVPKSELLDLGGRYRTFCVQRFDRGAGGEPAGRRMYASAITLLGRQDGQEGASYLDLAELIETEGGAGLAEDLRQLFRRAVFNLQVGNRDDHLRNHGFIREPSGWRLSPAFDMNPNPDKDVHALTWDGASGAPDLQVLRSAAAFFRITDSGEAQRILDEVNAVVRGWRQRAAALKLPRAEIQLMDSVFAV